MKSALRVNRIFLGAIGTFCLSFAIVANGQALRVLPTCCDLNSLGFGEETCSTGTGVSGKVNGGSSWEVPAFFMTTNTSTKFSLSTQPFQCEAMEDEHTYKISEPGPEPEFKVIPDGTVMVGDRLFASYYSPAQYCINGKMDNELHLKTCKFAYTQKEPGIRKCCPLQLIWSLKAQKCVEPGVTKWSPKLFRIPSDPDTLLTGEKLSQAGIRPRVMTRSPPTWMKNCPNGLLHWSPYSQSVIEDLERVEDWKPPNLQVMKFRLGPDGRLRHRNIYRKWVTIPDTHYCTDGVTGYSPEPRAFNDSLDESLGIMCIPEQFPERQASNYYGFLALFTSLFALVTVIAYFLLLSKQNIHGWTTMSHSSSVFMLFVWLGTAHLTKESVDLHNTPGCKFIATMAHYFFISTFSWLFLISFDLWCTFRSIKAGSAKQGLKRFMWYCLFGWGLPLVIVTISWVLEIKYRDDENSEIKVPMYGASFCYISRYALWEFVYGPVAILLFFNLLCFVMTALKLYQYQKSTAMATKNMKKDRQSFMLFVKLFFVVGALWIFEVISFSISGADITWYWQIFDTLNVLQPIAIFTIFVFKWEIINPLHEKYVLLRPILYPARTVLGRIRRRKHPVSTTSNSESAALNSRSSNPTRISRVVSAAEDNNTVV